MTLARRLELAAARRPSAEAVVDGSRRLDYATLLAQATSIGRAFCRRGVAPGDRVLIALRNRLEHVLAYWALQLIAAVPTPVSFRAAAGEMRYMLEDCGARVALLEADTAAAVLAAAAARDVQLVFVGRDAAPDGTVPFADLIEARDSDSGDAPRRPTESDLSLILYTSGTTGRPKGVPRTQRNHYAGAVAQALQCG